MAREYDIAKTTGRCGECGCELSPGQGFVAAVTETDQDLLRRDFCLNCWEGESRDNQLHLLGTWRGRIAQPQEKKKTFVDDELLIDFFRRLEGTDAPAKVNFRFVLGLILMRKKLLIYDRTASTSGEADVWETHIRGTDETYRLSDPHMDEQKITEVSSQLHQILEGEL